MGKSRNQGTPNPTVKHYIPNYVFIYIAVSWYAEQAYLTFCNPMNCSTSSFPVLHYLLEFAQIHVHWLRWCYPTISSSVAPFSSFPQFFPASGSFPMRSNNSKREILAVARVEWVNNECVFVSARHCARWLYSFSHWKLSDAHLSERRLVIREMMISLES